MLQVNPQEGEMLQDSVHPTIWGVIPVVPS
jgi:hypothetical protein